MLRNFPGLEFLFGQFFIWRVRRGSREAKQIQQEESIPESGPLNFSQRLRKARFNDNIPNYLCCIITQDIMVQPYMVDDNDEYTYEKEALDTWLEASEKQWQNAQRLEWLKLDEKKRPPFEEWIQQKKYVPKIPGREVPFYNKLVPNQKRARVINSFVNAVEKMAATYVKFERLEIESYLALFRDIKNAYDFTTIPYFLEKMLCQQLHDFALLTTHLISAFELIHPLQEFITTTQSIIKMDALNDYRTEEKDVLGKYIYRLEVINNITSISNLRSFLFVLDYLAEACLPRQSPSTTHAESFNEFKSRLSMEVSARNNVITALQHMLNYVSQNKLPNWLLIYKYDFISGLTTTLRKFEQSCRQRTINEFLFLIEHIPRMQSIVRKTDANAETAIREIDAKIKVIKDKCNSLHFIYHFLKLEQCDASRELLLALHEEQKREQIAAVTKHKLMLIDRYEQFLIVTDKIIKAEHHAKSPTLQEQKEISNLLESLLLEILPEEAKLEKKTRHDPFILERIKHLRLFTFGLTGTYLAFQSPLTLFTNRFQQKQVPRIEYFPGLAQEQHKSEKVDRDSPKSNLTF